MSEVKIVDTSMCRCDKGAAPGVLSVTSQQFVKTNGLLHATEGDKTITPFGVCAITRSACSMVLTQWVNTALHTKVNGMHYLTEKSKIPCGIGGMVSFVKSNQNFVKCAVRSTNNTTARATVAVSASTLSSQATTGVVAEQNAPIAETQTSQITAIQWHDGGTNLALHEVHYADTVYLTAQILNPVGNIAKVRIRKEDGSRFSRFATELKNTIAIDENGYIKIAAFEIKEQWSDFNTERECKLIATITHHGVSAQSTPLRIIPLANVLVYFRPGRTYNGEYGIDYLRDTTLSDLDSYKELVGTNRNDAEGNNIFTPKSKAYKALENAYAVELSWYTKQMQNDSSLPSYTNTYIALGKGKSATLDIVTKGINLADHTLTDITLEYDTALFKINSSKLSVFTPVCSKELPYGYEKNALTITCIQSFATDQIIKVMQGNRQLGQLTLVANDKDRHVDILFVRLKTNIANLDEAVSGNPTQTDSNSVTTVLNQALCTTFIQTIDFDITKDNVLHQKLREHYVIEKKGRFYINASAVATTDKDVLAFIRTTFEHQYPHYSPMHTIFFWGDIGVLKNKEGRFEEIEGLAKLFSKRAMVFKGFPSQTVIHELLHALGLEHTFDDRSDHTFKKFYTDNIMDYSAVRKQLWYWQWKRLWMWLDSKK